MAYNFPQELVFIQTLTASNSSTISFTSGINTNFNVYLIKIKNLIPVTNSTTIQMLFSTNGGSSYLATNYNYVDLWNDTGGGSGSDGAESTTSMAVGNSWSNAASASANCDIVLYNLNNTTRIKMAYAFSSGKDGTPTQEYVTACMNTASGTAVNAIRFKMNSGNISSGTFYLYGVQEP